MEFTSATFEEIKAILAANAVQLEKTQQKIEALTQQQAITDRQIRQTNKQLGEMNNKWGTFTEGMAGASIEKILFDKFGISNVGFRVKSKMNGESLELDGFGYANGTKNVAVIVEVKSHLRDDAIEQIENALDNFPKFFPEHADKKLYSLVVCAHAPVSFENLLRKKGIYLAVMHDDVFKLKSSKNFTPKDFSKN